VQTLPGASDGPALHDASKTHPTRHPQQRSNDVPVGARGRTMIASERWVMPQKFERHLPGCPECNIHTPRPFNCSIKCSHCSAAVVQSPCHSLSRCCPGTFRERQGPVTCSPNVITTHRSLHSQAFVLYKDSLEANGVSPLITPQHTNPLHQLNPLSASQTHTQCPDFLAASPTPSTRPHRVSWAGTRAARAARRPLATLAT
jgi:hypothetical protein